MHFSVIKFRKLVENAKISFHNFHFNLFSELLLNSKLHKRVETTKQSECRLVLLQISSLSVFDQRQSGNARNWKTGGAKFKPRSRLLT